VRVVVAAGTLFTAGVVYLYGLATDDNSVSSNNTSNASEANKKGNYSEMYRKIRTMKFA